LKTFLETFLVVATLIFFVFGSLFLLAPQTVEKLANLTNRAVLTVDDKIKGWRRPMGIILLALAIFCWYIALTK